ncbi:MAG TPA: HIT family protein [Candidatus Thermoplasmatota archaeon]|nr:HIT family protein [Candidatus Thermoplasmatota archaeon]
MAGECLFCRIVQGQIPSHKIYEDASTFAFLDIRPLTRGHTLVLPKTHAPKFEDLPPKEAQALFSTVHALVPRICQAVGAPATTIAINNGRESGQEVPHVHVHIVPRTRGDPGGPIHALFATRPLLAENEFPSLAEQIRTATPPAAR